MPSDASPVATMVLSLVVASSVVTTRSVLSNELTVWKDTPLSHTFMMRSPPVGLSRKYTHPAGSPPPPAPGAMYTYPPVSVFEFPAVRDRSLPSPSRVCPTDSVTSPASPAAPPVAAPDTMEMSPESPFAFSPVVTANAPDAGPIVDRMSDDRNTTSPPAAVSVVADVNVMVVAALTASAPLSAVTSTVAPCMVKPSSLSRLMSPPVCLASREKSLPGNALMLLRCKPSASANMVSALATPSRNRTAPVSPPPAALPPAKMMSPP